ncbi:septum formation family protein [Asanoa sp. NPDC049518]|uniref:septum formation family protein n=1 Tax=unclassified Asanoa TaxID=2685164 RepID=UPI00342FD325
MTEIHPQLLANRRRRRIMQVAVVVSLAIAAVGCFGVLNHIDQRSLHRDEYRKAADSLRLGQCVKELPDGDSVLNVTAIDCAKPHEAEVIGIVQLDGLRPFPTDDDLVDIQEDECAEELTKWAPAFVSDETVDVGVLYPEQRSWDLGERTITCFAAFTDGVRTGTLHR